MVPDVLVMSTKSLDKLTPEQQEIVKQAAKTRTDNGETLGNLRERRTCEKLRSRVLNFSPLIKSPSRMRGKKPMYDDIAKVQP